LDIFSRKITIMSAGAVKISHIPFGFFEKEMWKYFSQFGRVQRLKLFRSRKTGNSKGFAFVQFAHESVSKIVAETMNNYLMFDKILKCKFIPASKIQPSMFKSWRRVMIPKLGEQRHTEKVNSFKDEEHEAASRYRLFNKLKKRNEECCRLGIDYQFKIPNDTNGRPIVRPQQKRKIKTESRSEMGHLQTSVYSVIVDSDDDEIEFKTPPQAVKRRKLSKDDGTAMEQSRFDMSFVKDEPLSGDEEGEEAALRKAIAAAKSINLSSKAIAAKESKTIETSSMKIGKKHKKESKVNKSRKTKRYFNAA